MLSFGIFLCLCVLETYFLWELEASVVVVGEQKQEFCNLETVDISCPGPDPDIIYIVKAEYGRMQTGRCVTTDLGFLGCRVDVLIYLDKECSGRRHCSFSLPAPGLFDNYRSVSGSKRCPADTTPYLEVTYTCIKVLPVPVPHHCSDKNPVILSAPEGYLSPSSSAILGACPWRIEAKPGKQINITIFTFNSIHSCNHFGRIKEHNKPYTQISACPGNQRQKHLYTSDSSRVDIIFDNSANKESAVLLKYEVKGCPDLIPKEGQTITRTGNTAQVICDKNGSSEKSYLQCRDNAWMGYKNCTSDGPTTPANMSASFPYGLVIVVAIGVALGIFLGGLMLLCVSIYMKRKHRNYARPDYDIHDMEYNVPVQGGMTKDTYPQVNQTNTTLIPHHNGTEDTLISVTTTGRCAKHGLLPNQEELICVQPEDFTGSGPPPYNSSKGERKVANIGTPKCRDHLYEYPLT